MTRLLTKVQPEHPMCRHPVAQAIKAAVLEVEPGAEVILFGSRARGDWTEESDWDVLVLVQGGVDRVRRRALLDRIVDYEMATNWAHLVEILVHDEARWNGALSNPELVDNINEDGVIL